MRFGVLIVAALALGGCKSTRDREATDRSDQARAACNAQTFKTAVAKAQCINDAAAMSPLASGEYSDLFRVSAATRLVTAEKVDRGQISLAEAELAMAQSSSGLVSEAQRRLNSDRALAAQREASNRSVTCTTKPMFGNMQTTCN